MEFIIAVLFCLITAFAIGQRPADKKEKKDNRPVKVSLLSNYYEQDGNHSAVNGGLGSQELYSNAQEVAIYVPMKDSSALKVSGGYDYFTSASMAMIDKYKTSASLAVGDVSGDETRKYATLSYDMANKRERSIITPSIGFSTEYDVASFNMGLAKSKRLEAFEGHFTSGIQFIADRWMTVYPGEFRSPESNANANTNYYNGNTGGTYTTGASSYVQDGVTYYTGASAYGSAGNYSNSGLNSQGVVNNGTTNGTTAVDEVANATPIALAGRTITKDGKIHPVDWRYSFAWSNGYSFAINQRMNAMVGLDLLGQWGVLSTPFHRVYFNDGVSKEIDKEVRLERLPELRLKAALYGRFNYALNNFIVLRTYARLYRDDWNVNSLSLMVEAPIKVKQWLTVAPFYRVHFQKGTNYFRGYGEHIYSVESFYTSDYDLASFRIQKVGAALRVSPLGGITGIKDEDAQKYLFAWTALGARYGYFKRTDGLSAHSVTIELNFEF